LNCDAAMIRTLWLGCVLLTAVDGYESAQESECINPVGFHPTCLAQRLVKAPFVVKVHPFTDSGSHRRVGAEAEDQQA
jgi:hypothetical protein